MQHGDFTALADNYAKYRPGYSAFILESVFAILGKKDLKVADVGAGTGIWSRMLAGYGADVIAVEPNDAMLAEGQKQNNSLSISWKEGSAEETGLPDSCVDLVCMASSFHWPDFNKAVAEFKRILKPGGFFLALWNPRYLQDNPLLLGIEAKLSELVPDLKRISSGSSAFCEGLLHKLVDTKKFKDVLYMEAFHTEQQSQEHYIGLWKSVNDVQVQAGPERFSIFLQHITAVTSGMAYIEAKYKTRAWLAPINK